MDGLCKTYAQHVVLDHLTAVFPAGTVTCVTAPSGGGKTTLFRLLLGLETPDRGTITGLAGSRCSAVFQEDRLCENLNPVSNIRLVNPALSPAQVLEAMEAAELTGCEHQPAAELSGGMKRRVAILRALLAPWDVLFLDEPFKGLDADIKDKVIRFTREACSGRTVLLVTHDLREANAMGATAYLELPAAAGPGSFC